MTGESSQLSKKKLYVEFAKIYYKVQGNMLLLLSTTEVMVTM